MSDILCGVRPLQMGSESLFGLARPEVGLRKEAERVTVNQLTAGFPQRAHRVAHPDYAGIEIALADEHSSDDHRSHRGPVRKAVLTRDLLQRFGTRPDVCIVAAKVTKSDRIHQREGHAEWVAEPGREVEGLGSALEPCSGSLTY